MVSTDVRERVGIGRDRLRAGRPWPGRGPKQAPGLSCELHTMVLMSPRYSSGQAVRSTFWGELRRLGRRLHEAWRLGLGECRRRPVDLRGIRAASTRGYGRGSPSGRRRSQLVARSVCAATPLTWLNATRAALPWVWWLPSREVPTPQR